MHPSFMNDVVATEHTADVSFDTAWGNTACDKISPDVDGTVVGII